MPTIQFDQKFSRSLKKFIRGKPDIHAKIKNTLKTFAYNPTHPSFHLEKLSHSETWTIRIDRGNRLFFTWSETGNTAIFFFVGPHDAYKTMK